MKPVPSDVNVAMKRVAARPEGEIIREYFQQCRAGEYQALSKEHDAVVLRMIQGHVQVLDLLLDYWKP